MSQRPIEGGGHFQKQIGDVMLMIVQGDIVEESTDAIVNSTNDEMDLQGCASQALVKKGGSQIVDECRKRGKIGGNGVFAASASGSMLNCKYVIHVNILLAVGELVRQCLLEADRLKLSSIAIPAMGTGNRKGSPDLIAPGMVKGAFSFIRDVKHPNIKLIKFVIFQAGMVEAFVQAAGRQTLAPGVGFSVVEIERGIELPLAKEVDHQLPVDGVARSTTAATGHTVTHKFTVPAATLTTEVVSEYCQVGTVHGVCLNVEMAAGSITLTSSDAAAAATVRQYIVKASQDQQLCGSAQWQYRNEKGMWVNYSPGLNRKLEFAHRANKTMLSYKSSTHTLVVDLVREQDYVESDSGRHTAAAVRRIDQQT